MEGHEEFLQILASYRDAPAEERAAADAHLSDCAACAARFAAYGEIDRTVAELPLPALPPRLRQPLPAVLWGLDKRTAAGPPLGIRFGGTLAPAGVVIVLLIALSAILMSVNAGRVPVTTTPTLTTTLTPTTIVARQTEPAIFGGVARTSAAALPYMPGLVPTPAPAPAPLSRRSTVLFAGYAAHATMIH